MRPNHQTTDKKRGISMKTKIGIIGLGTMGMGIAENLLKRGYVVQGFDLLPERMQVLERKGGTAAPSPAQAADGASALILMVFNGEQVQDVLFGQDGAANVLPKGGSVLVTASVGYAACEEAEKGLEPLGLHLVDCPVRGTAATSASGELYLMVGASPEAFSKNQELLNQLGSTVIHVGDKPGMGQKAKTCMQAFFSLMFEGTCELLALGTASGLDPRTVFEVLDGTSASNGIFRATAKHVAGRVFTGTGNPLSILDKDMQIACASASAFGLSLPALEGISSNFRESMKQCGKEDIWSVVKTLEQPAGLEIQFDFPE